MFSLSTRGSLQPSLESFSTSPSSTWCGVVWCGVVWCGVVWCGVVWCGVVWCGVVWCGVVRCVEMFKHNTFVSHHHTPQLPQMSKYHEEGEGEGGRKTKKETGRGVVGLLQSSGLRKMLLHMVGLGVGLSIMLLIGLYEDRIVVQLV